MSKKRKKLILLGLALLLGLFTTVALVLYYVQSPAKVKALVEHSISRATGTECSIRELSYSLNPMCLHARGIQLIDHGQWFFLEIPELVTELSLQGSFTRKSLVVKHLSIKGLSLYTYPSFSLAETARNAAVPSFFSRLARGLVGLLLFRDIQVDDAELSGGHVNSEMGEQILTMSGILLRLGEDQFLQISGYGRLRWRSEEMEVTMPDLQLTADRAISIVDPEIRMSLKARDMAFTAPLGKADRISGEAELLYDRDKGLLSFSSARLSSESLTLKGADGSATPALAMHLSAAGFVDLPSKKAEAQRFHLILNRIMEATGAFHAQMGAQPEVKLTGLGLQVTLEKAWPLLSSAFGIKAQSLQFGGHAEVNGNLGGILERDAWQWDCDLQARLKHNEISFTTPDTRGRGVVTANLQMKGRYPEVETELTFAVEKGEISRKGVGIRSARAAFSASGKGRDFAVQNLDFRASQAEIPLGGKRVLLPEITATMQRGTIDFTRTRLSLPKIDIHTSLMRNLHLSLEAYEKEVTFDLAGKDVGFFTLAQAMHFVPADWQFEGLDSLLMKGSIKEDGHWILESTWTLDPFAFQSPDLRYAGEKISLGLRLRATGGPGQARWSTAAEGSAGKGGFLYDRIYLDLEKNSLQVQVQGSYDGSHGTADISRFKVVLKDLLSLEGEGQLNDLALQHPCHLRARLLQTPLKPAFQILLKEPLEQEVPFLAELDVGGDVMAEMEFERQTEGWRLLGHCAWREGEVLGKGFSVEGIDLDLPLWGESPRTSGEPLFKGRTPSAEGFRSEGSLYIRSMDLPHLPKQSFTARAHSAPNLLSFRPQDSIKAPGGKIEIGPIAVPGLFTLSPSLVTSLTLKEGDLTPLLSELWSRPVQGSVRGKLDLLDFDGDKIQTKGQIRVQAFGGEIALTNLGGSGLLRSTPTFLLDATWRDLHLAELTKGTPFETIEGILKGQVKHLEVVGWEPQRFDLFVETVQNKEVPQKISVRALENIARIGGGESPFIGLAGAFASLFREFPYDKIAIQASLDNDIFRIDGPLKEGDKVYLVKRSGFSGVNVVNQDPNRRISFKDMMKRIKRVAASKGSPSADEQTPKNEH